MNDETDIIRIRGRCRIGALCDFHQSERLIGPAARERHHDGPKRSPDCRRGNNARGTTDPGFRAWGNDAETNHFRDKLNENIRIDDRFRACGNTHTGANSRAGAQTRRPVC